MNSSFDGKKYRRVKSSKYSHKLAGRLANYRKNALVTGCSSYNSPNKECDRKTELMNVTANVWSDGPDYPFGDVIMYSSISTAKSAYIIGGDTPVVEFFDYKWLLVGNLKHRRYRHESILIGNQIFIIGGSYRGHK